MPASALIDELVLRWDEARARGEETSMEKLCRDHPELVEPVGQIIALRQADLSVPAKSGSPGPRTDAPAPAPAESSATASFSCPSDWHDGLRPPELAGEIGRLGPFRVMKLLGAGGMGSVYQAIDSQLGRSVALKVMQAPRADSERARARFLREARTAAALQHDRIVSVYQFGEENGVLYLAMPLLQGQTLRDRLKQSPPLPMAAILQIGRETAEGLAAAHELGLIHRDVKPGNVWLEEGSGRVKILDFGLARVANEDSHLTQDGTVVGTPAFMAPEQARGREDSDCRSDLFSLGGILYRMVTGKLPFPADHTTAMLLSLLSDDPIPPRTLNPAISPALEALILHLLAKDPAARPQSARLVVEAIRALEQSESSPSGSSLDITVQVDSDDSSGRGRPQRPAVKRWFPVVPAAALVFLVVGIATGVALRSWRLDGTGDRAAALSAGGDAKVRIWSADGTPGPVLTGLTRTVDSVAWSPDGKRLAAGSSAAELRIRGAHGHPGPALTALRLSSAVAFSPDGTKIVSASSAHPSLLLWGPDDVPGKVLKGRSRHVKSLAWSADGTRIAAAGSDATVQIWYADSTRGPTLSGHLGEVNSVAWSPDGSRLAVGNLGAGVQLWGQDYPASPPLTIKANNAEAIAWHPGSTRLATANPLSVIRLWDVDGLEGPALTTHLAPGDWREGGVNVAWTPYGDRLLAASHHGFVWAWNARTLATEWVAVQTSPASVTLFSPEGRLLRSDPAALKNFVYLLERSDRGIELLTHQQFEESTAGKW